MTRGGAGDEGRGWKEEENRVLTVGTCTEWHYLPVGHGNIQVLYTATCRSI